MKTIIAGSREGFKISDIINAIADSHWVITEVVSGRCRGVDRLGEDYANAVGIPIKEFPADWDKHGKKAGHIRNQEMAEYADALIALWDGKSPGTNDMISRALRENLLVSINGVVV